jgi:hypothetical protein
MYRQVSFLVLAVAAGVLVGALGAFTWSGASLKSDPAEIPAKSSLRPIQQDPSGKPSSEHLAETVQSLAKVLDAEINERRVLTDQLEALKSELADLKQNLGVRVEEAFRADDASRRRESGGAVEQTPEERLAAAGFTHQQLESIQRLQAEAEMARIDLDDRARREGWINTPRYVRESRNLPTAEAVLRNALGDAAYDRYLFANGFPNRVTVGSIIETSPAGNAGFQRGDVVVSYGGENVYSAEQLITLRSSGARGEPVAVEILRNDQLLQLTIPRGPMGMSVASMRVDPTSPGQ